MQVRRALHRLGYRYVLHPNGLPGRPDLAFPSRKIALFVHGCFWHAHTCKHGRVQSKTNVEFWTRKLKDNRLRDARKRQQLRAIGWTPVEVWECQVKRGAWLDRILSVLG